MKTFLPTDLINDNYTYNINNDTIIVRTNNNCYTQYTSTYCDCVNVFPKLDYLRSEVYSCNVNQNASNNVSRETFTDDYFYRLDLTNILIIFIILFIFVIYFPYRIICRWFGRWLKV